MAVSNLGICVPLDKGLSYEELESSLARSYADVLISNLPYVEECMVFGQPRNHDGDHKDLAICAKIVYKPEWMKENHGLEVGAAQIEALVKADIGKINETLPTYKQRLRVVVTDQEMIKTTTGKVKRYEEEKKM